MQYRAQTALASDTSQIAIISESTLRYTIIIISNPYQSLLRNYIKD